MYKYMNDTIMIEIRTSCAPAVAMDDHPYCIVPARVELELELELPTATSPASACQEKDASRSMNHVQSDKG